MPSVLAIVSKAIFERDAKTGGRVAGEGDVVPLDRYVSKNKAIAPVAEGGALFLVTVRPPDEKLWLVGVLESPAFDGERWNASKNTVPIRDVSGLKDKIKFASGTGISAKKGALGMSLQTPRVLTDADIALLRAGAAGAPIAASNGLRHLNAHEPSSPTPCLCKQCIGAAPDKVTVDTLTLVRERAEAKGRFLWFWMPESLEADRESIRRAVASRLHARAQEPGKKKHFENLDKVFAEASGSSDEDEDEDDE